MADAVGSAVIATADPVVTAGNCRPTDTGISAGSSRSHLPSGVIPTAVTSKSTGSMLASTPAAEMQDTGCSPLRPPKTTATRIRSEVMVSHPNVARLAHRPTGLRLAERHRASGCPPTVPPTGGRAGVDSLRGVRPVHQVADHLGRRQMPITHLIHGLGDRHV